MRGREEGAVIVGWVLGAHGLRGEVKVKPAGQDGSTFFRYSMLWIGPEDGKGEWFRVDGVRKTGSGATIKLEGVNDRNQAESLQGSVLKVKSIQCKTLPKDSYYVHDLIGLEVQTPDHRRIGTVTDVMAMPSQDILVIDSQGKEVLIPAVKAFIKDVDLRARMVTLDPIEGMLHENAD